MKNRNVVLAVVGFLLGYTIGIAVTAAFAKQPDKVSSVVVTLQEMQSGDTVKFSCVPIVTTITQKPTYK